MFSRRNKDEFDLNDLDSRDPGDTPYSTLYGSDRIEKGYVSGKRYAEELDRGTITASGTYGGPSTRKDAKFYQGTNLPFTLASDLENPNLTTKSSVIIPLDVHRLTRFLVPRPHLRSDPVEMKKAQQTAKTEQEDTNDKLEYQSRLRSVAASLDVLNAIVKDGVSKEAGKPNKDDICAMAGFVKGDCLTCMMNVHPEFASFNEEDSTRARTIDHSHLQVMLAGRYNFNCQVPSYELDKVIQHAIPATILQLFRIYSTCVFLKKDNPNSGLHDFSGHCVADDDSISDSAALPETFAYENGLFDLREENKAFNLEVHVSLDALMQYFSVCKEVKKYILEQCASSIILKDSNGKIITHGDSTESGTMEMKCKTKMTDIKLELSDILDQVISGKITTTGLTDLLKKMKKKTLISDDLEKIRQIRNANFFNNTTGDDDKNNTDNFQDDVFDKWYISNIISLIEGVSFVPKFIADKGKKGMDKPAHFTFGKDTYSLTAESPPEEADESKDGNNNTIDENEQRKLHQQQLEKVNFMDFLRRLYSQREINKDEWLLKVCLLKQTSIQIGAKLNMEHVKALEESIALIRPILIAKNSDTPSIDQILGIVEYIPTLIKEISANSTSSCNTIMKKGGQEAKKYLRLNYFVGLTRMEDNDKGRKDHCHIHIMHLQDNYTYLQLYDRLSAVESKQKQRDVFPHEVSLFEYFYDYASYDKCDVEKITNNMATYALTRRRPACPVPSNDVDYIKPSVNESDFEAIAKLDCLEESLLGLRKAVDILIYDAEKIDYIYDLAVDDRKQIPPDFETKFNVSWSGSMFGMIDNESFPLPKSLRLSMARLSTRDKLRFLCCLRLSAEDIRGSNIPLITDGLLRVADDLPKVPDIASGKRKDAKCSSRQVAITEYEKKLRIHSYLIGFRGLLFMCCVAHQLGVIKDRTLVAWRQKDNRCADDEQSEQLWRTLVSLVESFTNITHAQTQSIDPIRTGLLDFDRTVMSRLSYFMHTEFGCNSSGIVPADDAKDDNNSSSKDVTGLTRVTYNPVTSKSQIPTAMNTCATLLVCIFNIVRLKIMKMTYSSSSTGEQQFKSDMNNIFATQAKIFQDRQLAAAAGLLTDSQQNKAIEKSYKFFDGRGKGKSSSSSKGDDDDNDDDDDNSKGNKGSGQAGKIDEKYVKKQIESWAANVYDIIGALSISGFAISLEDGLAGGMDRAIPKNKDASVTNVFKWHRAMGLKDPKYDLPTENSADIGVKLKKEGTMTPIQNLEFNLKNSATIMILHGMEFAQGSPSEKYFETVLKWVSEVPSLSSLKAVIERQKSYLEQTFGSLNGITLDDSIYVFSVCNKTKNHNTILFRDLDKTEVYFMDQTSTQPSVVLNKMTLNLEFEEEPNFVYLLKEGDMSSASGTIYPHFQIQNTNSTNLTPEHFSNGSACLFLLERLRKTQQNLNDHITMIALDNKSDYKGLITSLMRALPLMFDQSSTENETLFYMFIFAIGYYAAKANFIHLSIFFLTFFNGDQIKTIKTKSKASLTNSTESLGAIDTYEKWGSCMVSKGITALQCGIITFNFTALENDFEVVLKSDFDFSQILAREHEFLSGGKNWIDAAIKPTLSEKTSNTILEFYPGYLWTFLTSRLKDSGETNTIQRVVKNDANLGDEKINNLVVIMGNSANDKSADLSAEIGQLISRVKELQLPMTFTKPNDAKASFYKFYQGQVDVLVKNLSEN